jgi:eukaryotic-like serine/threonine-protein kinase
VSDFGLAKLISAESDLTRSVDLLGTPHYVAPEVAAHSARRATTASDIYSLGAILYELLSGRPPFQAEGLPALLQKIAEAEPARITGYELQPTTGLTGERLHGFAPVVEAVPRDLEIICFKCLAKNPASRYGSARELAEDLQRWLEGRTIEARPARAVERAWFWTRRNPGPAILSALLGFAVVLATLLQARSRRNLRSALNEARAAQVAAGQELQQILLAQARAQRQSGRLGQRYQSLASISRLAQIRSSIEARREAAAALALPDLKLLPGLRVFFANAESTVDFSPDLRRYVTGRPEGGFLLRDASDSRVLGTFGWDQPLTAHQLHLSPGGGFASATYLDGSAEVWALQRSRRVWRREAGQVEPVPPVFEPHDAGFAFALTNGAVFWQSLETGPGRALSPPGLSVRGFSFAPSGRTLAVVREGTIEVRGLESADLRWSLSGEFNTPEPAWNSDGDQIAVGSGANDEIMLLNAGTGAIERHLEAEPEQPTRLAFQPHGRWLASVGLDRELRLWDLPAGKVKLETGAAPRTLRFSSDGRRLALAPGHLAVALAELAPENVWHELRAPPSHAASCFWISISPDGSLAATCDTEEIRLWDTRAGRLVYAFAAPSRWAASVFFDPEDRWLIYSGVGKGVFRRELRRPGRGGRGSLEIEIGAEEPLGRPGDGLLTALGAGGHQWVIERRRDRQLVVWPDGQPDRERILMSGERFNGAALSPGGHWLATLTAPLPGVTIWNTSDPTLHTELALPGHADCCFSPDGHWLLTGTAERYSLWAMGSWREVTNWPASLSAKGRGAIFFSPAGDLVCLQQDRDSLQLCRTRDYHELITLEPPKAIDMASVAWSPDGRRLYLLGSRDRLFAWDLEVLRAELASLGLDW